MNIINTTETCIHVCGVTLITFLSFIYSSVNASTINPLSYSSGSLNYISTSHYEPGLIGEGGILDTAYGLENLQRIDDNLDRYWNVSGAEVTVSSVAKHVGFSQNFGFIDGNGNFSSLLFVPDMNTQSSAFTINDSGSPFRFGLDPSGSPLFSSDPLDNIYCHGHSCSQPNDHMVSWLITDGVYAGDYVLAWEDLKHLGDHDYNDLVVRVSGASVVPVPSSIVLLMSGMLGLASVARRRNKTNSINDRN